MTRSRGGVTGGGTIEDALRAFEEKGFTKQFASRPGGEIICFSCRETAPAEDVHLAGVGRVEGVSDPADETVVVALECPLCGARGTAAFGYGPLAAAEDAEAFRRLHDEREESLAHDATGALRP